MSLRQRVVLLSLATLLVAAGFAALAFRPQLMGVITAVAAAS